MDHTVLGFLQTTPYLHLPCKRSLDGATTDCCRRHVISAYYSFIDPKSMKGWVGLEINALSIRKEQVLVGLHHCKCRWRFFAPITIRRTTFVGVIARSRLQAAVGYCCWSQHMMWVCPWIHGSVRHARFTSGKDQNVPRPSCIDRSVKFLTLRENADRFFGRISAADGRIYFRGVFNQMAAIAGRRYATWQSLPFCYRASAYWRAISI